jgi:hypothetical protein
LIARKYPDNDFLRALCALRVLRGSNNKHLGVLGVLAVKEKRQATIGKGEGMESWEYRRSTNEGELEALGRAGWELVAVVQGKEAGEVVFYLKRPAPDFREEVTLDQKRRYYGLMGVPAASNDEAGRQ